MKCTATIMMAILAISPFAQASDAAAASGVAKTRFHICTHATDDEGNRKYSNGYCLKWALKFEKKAEAQEDAGFDSSLALNRSRGPGLIRRNVAAPRIHMKKTSIY